MQGIEAAAEVDMEKKPSVFLSFLGLGARYEALALCRYLREQGSCDVYCDPFRHCSQAGEKAAKKAIDAADLVVVLATKMYGQRTTERFSTHDELRYIFRKDKSVVLIQMCRCLKYVSTRCLLSLMCHQTLAWQPQLSATPHLARNRPPADLLREIVVFGEMAMLAVEEETSHTTVPLTNMTQGRGTKHPTAWAPPADHEAEASGGDGPERVKNEAPLGSLEWQQEQQKPMRRRVSASSIMANRNSNTFESSGNDSFIINTTRKSLSTQSNRNRRSRARRARAVTQPPRPEPKIVKTSCVDVLLRMLAKHHSDAQPPESTLGALVACMLEKGPASVSTGMIANASALDGLLAVSRKHPNSRILQRCALYILKHTIKAVLMPGLSNTSSSTGIISNSGSDGASRVQGRRAAGGANNVVEAWDCCFGSVYECLQESIVIALLAMNTHPSDATLQKHGCRILELMVHHSPRACALALELNALGSITQTMAMHRENPRIQHSGCRALHALACKIDGALPTILQCGGLGAAAAALKLHTQPANIVKEACACLRTLATQLSEQPSALLAAPEHAAPVAAGRGGASLAAARRRSSLISMASIINTTMAEASLDIVMGVDALLDALQEHADQRDVQRDGMQALAHLLSLLPRAVENCLDETDLMSANGMPSQEELLTRAHICATAALERFSSRHDIVLPANRVVLACSHDT